MGLDQVLPFMTSPGINGAVVVDGDGGVPSLRASWAVPRGDGTRAGSILEYGNSDCNLNILTR